MFQNPLVWKVKCAQLPLSYQNSSEMPGPLCKFLWCLFSQAVTLYLDRANRNQAWALCYRSFKQAEGHRLWNRSDSPFGSAAFRALSLTPVCLKLNGKQQFNLKAHCVILCCYTGWIMLLPVKEKWYPWQSGHIILYFWQWIVKKGTWLMTYWF